MEEQKKRLNAFLNLTLLSRVAFVIALICLSFYGGTKLFSRKENLSKKIDQLNQQFSYYKINKVNALEFANGGDVPLYTFTLKPEYYIYGDTFLSKQYYKKKGGLYKFAISRLCEVVDSIHKNPNKKIRDIAGQIEVSGEIEVPPIKGRVNTTLGVLYELLYGILEVGKNYKVDIYVRGFADGSINNKNWDEEFPIDEDSFYHYKKVSCLKTLDRGANASIYSSEVTDVPFEPHKYFNKDLPNLRAKFYKEDLIEKAIRQCPNRVRNIYILNGFEEDEHNPNQRRVEVFFREVN